MVRFLSAAFALLISTALALAQTANIQGIYLTGTPPTGFGTQAFKFDCSTSTPTSGTCWPLMELVNQNPNGQQPATNSQPMTLPPGQYSVDPCAMHGTVIGTAPKSTLPFSSTSGQFEIISRPSSGLVTIYVCSIILTTTGQTSFSLLSGQPPNCTGSGPTATAVLGSLTAASGMDIAALNGLSWGNGAGTVLTANIPGNALCILQSASGNKIAGSISYVQTQF